MTDRQKLIFVLGGMFFPLLILAYTEDARCQSVENYCTPCDIKYKFDTVQCALIRWAVCDGILRRFRCVEIPGMTSNECEISHANKQGWIKSVQADANGKAKIRNCDADGKCLDAVERECTITFLKTLETKPLQIGSKAEGVIGKDTLFVDTLLTYSCTWDGDSVIYSVSNHSETQLIVTWPETPFLYTDIGANFQEIRRLYSPTTPAAIFNSMIVDDTVTSGFTEIEVVTFALCRAKPGDANSDNNVSLPDIIFLVNYIFKGGPAPSPLCRGDANASGANPTLPDIIYLVNHIFKGGAAPIKIGVCCL